MAVVITTATNEEVRQSRIRETTPHKMDGWVKQAQDFHAGDSCLCPV